MNGTRRLATIAGFFVLAASAAAQNTGLLDKPVYQARQAAKTNAVVEDIHLPTRRVTLRMADGRTERLAVGEETRNLEALSKGDIVTAEYEQAISIRVLPGDGSEPVANQVTETERTGDGEKPGLAAFGERRATAVIDDVDLAANTFRLREPDGTVREYEARNPDNLRRVAVGDLVVITITEFVAISVE